MLFGRVQLDLVKKKFKNIFKNILATELKSYIKWLLYIYIYIFFFEKVEKIGYHSNFNFECNTDSGSKESLSIALGMWVKPPHDRRFVKGRS